MTQSRRLHYSTTTAHHSTSHILNHNGTPLNITHYSTTTAHHSTSHITQPQRHATQHHTLLNHNDWPRRCQRCSPIARGDEARPAYHIPTSPCSTPKYHDWRYSTLHLKVTYGPPQRFPFLGLLVLLPLFYCLGSRPTNALLLILLLTKCCPITINICEYLSKSVNSN